MIEYKNLEEKLSELTGHHFKMAERQARAAGITDLNLTLSTGFQVRLASIALGVTAGDVEDLPLKDFANVVNTVFRFLFSSSETEEIASENSKNAQ